MPPRFAYWTIILDGIPTSFRAKEQSELQPTFNALKRKNPGAIMKWFSGGRLWDSPEQAKEERQLARDRQFREERDRQPRDVHRSKDWRPGGEHRDPRDKYKLPPGEARKRWKQRHLGPGGSRPFGARPGDSKPAQGGPDGPGPFVEKPAEAKPFEEKPHGAKPFSAKPFAGKPYGAKPFAGKPGGARPFGSKPFGGKPFGAKPFGGKPFDGKPPGDRPSSGRPYGGRPGGGSRPPGRGRRTP
jgi:23S rRNA pseudouridine2605 synthase